MTIKVAKSPQPADGNPPLPPTLLMRSGNTNNLFTFRNAGVEGVNLQSAAHGVQQIANFNPAAGDFLSLDSVLNTTLAHASLSDLSQYITSQATSSGTMLYLDPTGHGAQTSPFAFLQGVTTSVAQILAAGGFKYIPEAMTVTPTFNVATNLRPDGLATVLLNRMEPGVGPQVINFFNAATDKLELKNILNRTSALPNLSNLASFVTVSHAGGNTILSLDPTGQGGAGTAFAVLDNVTLSLSQLVADNALMFDPTPVTVMPTINTPFTFRSEGAEMAITPAVRGNNQTMTFLNFSVSNGDGLNVTPILQNAGVSPDLGSIQNYLTLTQSGADTQLWFDPTGSGLQTTLEAVFKNSLFTMNDLIEHSALALTHGLPATVGPDFTMRMGCTNETITYMAAGNEGVCVQSLDHGIQQLVNFNPAAGDFVSVDDVLELTLAHDDMSDVANYITSQVVNGGTMLYADLTGQGKQGSPFAFLQGVQTNVAAMVADGGLRYIPDDITVSPAAGSSVSLRPDGLETVKVSMAPGLTATQINFFNPAQDEQIELVNILGKTLAAANLSDVANYIMATNVGGNTILSVDPTGHGGAGTAFAVLNGVTTTVTQLMANHALIYDPTGMEMAPVANTPFTYRSAGAEIANLLNVHGTTGVQLLSGFALNGGDGIDVTRILGAADIQTDLSNIQNYFSTVQAGADTQLWFDPTGSGQGGTLEAVFQNTSVTLTDMLAHSAIHIPTN